MPEVTNTLFRQQTFPSLRGLLSIWIRPFLGATTWTLRGTTQNARNKFRRV